MKMHAIEVNVANQYDNTENRMQYFDILSNLKRINRNFKVKKSNFDYLEFMFHDGTPIIVSDDYEKMKNLSKKNITDIEASLNNIIYDIILDEAVKRRKRKAIRSEERSIEDINKTIRSLRKRLLSDKKIDKEEEQHIRDGLKRNIALKRVHMLEMFRLQKELGKLTGSYVDRLANLEATEAEDRRDSKIDIPKDVITSISKAKADNKAKAAKDVKKAEDIKEFEDLKAKINEAKDTKKAKKATKATKKKSTNKTKVLL